MMNEFWSLASSKLEFIVQYMTTLSVISTIGLGVLIWTHYHYKNVYSYWPNKSVRGPKTVPIFGNMLQFVIGPRMQLEKRWLKEYGKVFGYYFGKEPILVVADPEVARQICIRDFEYFPNHDLNDYLNSYQRDFLVFLLDEHWKRARSLMSPTFTSGKIKRMFKLLDVCANDLVEWFNYQVKPSKCSQGSDQTASNGKSINVKDPFALYTMDAIASCCYGLKLDKCAGSSEKTNSSRDGFATLVIKLLELNRLRLLAGFLVPKFVMKYFKFELTPKKVFEPLAVRTTKLIEMRRKQGTTKKFDDYLQILLDAKLDDKLELDDMDLEENHHAGLTQDSLISDQRRMANEVMKEKYANVSGSSDQNDGDRSQFKLTDNEILVNAMLILMVGVETTGNLLTSCTYTLAFHADIQQRLHEEIKSIAKYDQNTKRYLFEYESLTCCHYLDSVISETLRSYPAVVRTDRVVKYDYHIDKYNIDLPAGAKIAIGLCEMMNDADHWPDPEKFDPERFMPANRDKIVPGSYCPFGLGPRHCIGMRFSLTEAKLALAKLVMNYRFEPAPGTEYPPPPKFSMGLNGPKNPVVKVIQRAYQ